MKRLLLFSILSLGCWNFGSLTEDTNCATSQTVAEVGLCVQRCVDATAKPVRCVLFSGGLVRYFVDGSDDGTLTVGLLPSTCQSAGNVAKIAPTMLKLRRVDVAVGLQGSLCDTGGDYVAEVGKFYYAAE